MYEPCFKKLNPSDREEAARGVESAAECTRRPNVEVVSVHVRRSTFKALEQCGASGLLIKVMSEPRISEPRLAKNTVFR